MATHEELIASTFNGPTQEEHGIKLLEFLESMTDEEFRERQNCICREIEEAAEQRRLDEIEGEK